MLTPMVEKLDVVRHKLLKNLLADGSASHGYEL